MTDKSGLLQLLENLGKSLHFDVKAEVGASESAWVDMVWFDSRLPVDAARPLQLRHSIVLPVVGFEVEFHTGLNAKHVKGSVSNLNNLGALLGVIVIGEANIDALGKQPANAKKTPGELRKILSDRVYRWVYAEAQPKGRVVVMFEQEVRDWAEKMRLMKSSTEETSESRKVATAGIV